LYLLANSMFLLYSYVNDYHAIGRKITKSRWNNCLFWNEFLLVLEILSNFVVLKSAHRAWREYFT